jgi:hypothetical protein
VANGRRRKCFI